MTYEIEMRVQDIRGNGDWEYLDAVKGDYMTEIETKASERIAYDNCPVTGADFRMCPEEGGGGDEFLYFRNGVWTDPAQA